ncbi:hypothetical protein Z043_121845, partial [Scleropages formosus]
QLLLISKLNPPYKCQLAVIIPTRDVGATLHASVLSLWLRSTKVSTDMVRNQIAGLSLILVMALMVLLYHLVERCCVSPALRLEEPRDEALQKAQEENAMMFIQARAKERVTQNEAHQYKTLLLDQPLDIQSLVAPSAPPKNLTAKETCVTVFQ